MHVRVRRIAGGPAGRHLLLNRSVPHTRTGDLTAGVGLLFPGRDPRRPMNHSALLRRTKRAWEGVGLHPLGLHEARHTFASLLIASGTNAKAVSTYMGHSSIAITYDHYGHLFPGSEVEVRGLLDAYLDGGHGA